MALTPERVQELYEMYKELKERILEIDNKYSLQYVEIDFDMPESLNLQKLVYTPKTDEELMELADKEVAAAVIAKQRSLDVNYATKLKNLSAQRQQRSQSVMSALKKLDDELQQTLEKYQKQIIDNGLYFSNTITKYTTLANSQYDADKSAINSKYVTDLTNFTAREKDAEELYKQSCELLESEKQARLDNAYQKLLISEEKTKTNIEKYNNSLEEKERKYQFQRAKAYESARRAEYNRAFTATKLYAELGEVGYRNRVIMEKYTVCQQYFMPLRRSEANSVLSFDGFLITHLDIYYDAFVEWVNYALLPDNPS